MARSSSTRMSSATFDARTGSRSLSLVPEKGLQFVETTKCSAAAERSIFVDWRPDWRATTSEWNVPPPLSRADAFQYVYPSPPMSGVPSSPESAKSSDTKPARESRSSPTRRRSAALPTTTETSQRLRSRGSSDSLSHDHAETLNIGGFPPPPSANVREQSVQTAGRSVLTAPSTIPEPRRARGKANTVVACNNCKSKHLKCSDERPCERCVKMGLQVWQNLSRMGTVC